MLLLMGVAKHLVHEATLIQATAAYYILIFNDMPYMLRWQVQQESYVISRSALRPAPQADTKNNEVKLEAAHSRQHFTESDSAMPSLFCWLQALPALPSCLPTWSNSCSLISLPSRVLAAVRAMSLLNSSFRSTTPSWPHLLKYCCSTSDREVRENLLQPSFAEFPPAKLWIQVSTINTLHAMQRGNECDPFPVYCYSGKSTTQQDQDARGLMTWKLSLGLQCMTELCKNHRPRSDLDCCIQLGEHHYMTRGQEWILTSRVKVPDCQHLGNLGQQPAYLCLCCKHGHVLLQAVPLQGFCEEPELLSANFLVHVVDDALAEGWDVEVVHLYARTVVTACQPIANNS